MCMHEKGSSGMGFFFKGSEAAGTKEVRPQKRETKEANGHTDAYAWHASQPNNGTDVFFPPRKRGRGTNTKEGNVAA